MGCGEGCLKCDYYSSGTFCPYTMSVNSGYQKRLCLVCDIDNGYGMVEEGICLKNTDS